MELLIKLICEVVIRAAYWLFQLLFWLPGYLIMRLFADDDQVARVGWLGIPLSVGFWIALVLVVIVAAQ